MQTQLDPEPCPTLEDALLEALRAVRSVTSGQRVSNAAFGRFAARPSGFWWTVTITQTRVLGNTKAARSNAAESDAAAVRDAERKVAEAYTNDRARLDVESARTAVEG